MSNILSQAESWQLQFFSLLCQYFEASWSDCLIQELYSDSGVELRVDNDETMTSARVFVPGELITVELIRDCRKLWRSIPKAKQ